VFASDYAPEEIAEIAQRLRAQAGLPEIPTGQVASTPNGDRPASKKTTRKTAARKPAAKAKRK
jgi:hypothetical protein